MRLRDMGLKPKQLISAAAEAGIHISSKRASEIINGQSFIKQNEMEVIAKILNKTIDELYIQLGSVLEVICPVMAAGMRKPIICCRQMCAWWDWEKQWCTVKGSKKPEDAKKDPTVETIG